MGSILQSLRRIARPYFRDLSPLRSATSVADLHRWYESIAQSSGAGLGFNGCVLRACVVRAAFETAGCNVFVETGTYRAATTLLAARLLGCPVYTGELQPRNWLIAAARCAPFLRIHTRLGDSRQFLQAMAAKLPDSSVPFLYLDAHWYADLPLQRELEIVWARWKQCLVLIDDFKVPGQPGFGFDAYGGKALSLEDVAIPVDPSDRSSGIYFPAYRPEEETGGRRGYVLIARGLRDRLGACDRFPLNLLREHLPAGSAS